MIPNHNPKIKNVTLDGLSVDPQVAALMSKEDWVKEHQALAEIAVGWKLKTPEKRTADLGTLYDLAMEKMPKAEPTKPAAPVKPTPNGNGNNSSGNA